MAGGYGSKSKRGGFVGNMAKMGGAKRKLAMTSDFRMENTQAHGGKKAAKQAHKKV